jgi:cation:H+ antiporter
MEEYRHIAHALSGAGKHFWFVTSVASLLAAGASVLRLDAASYLLLFVVSLAFLLKSADFLVCGSSGLARYYGVSAMIIGITVVAFGTSLPELMVSVVANLVGSSGITIGNIVGSNIANICLVLGLAAVIVPIGIKRSLFRFDAPFLMAITLLLPLLAFRLAFEPSSSPYVLGPLDGIIMLVLFVFFIYYQIRHSSEGSDKRAKARNKARSARDRRKLMGFASLIIGGLLGVMLSAALLVQTGREIARIFGVPELVIGLTMVAVGTSLPELATNVMAALRKKLDIAVGNVIGSNIFNILLILGTSSAIRPIEIMQQSVMTFDIPVMVALTALILLLMRRRFMLSRWEGILLLAIYFSYIYYLFVSSVA